MGTVTDPQRPGSPVRTPISAHHMVALGFVQGDDPARFICPNTLACKQCITRSRQCTTVPFCVVESLGKRYLWRWACEPCTRRDCSCSSEEAYFTYTTEPPLKPYPSYTSEFSTYPLPLPQYSSESTRTALRRGGQRSGKDAKPPPKGRQEPKHRQHIASKSALKGGKGVSQGGEWSPMTEAVLVSPTESEKAPPREGAATLRPEQPSVDPEPILNGPPRVPPSSTPPPTAITALTEAKPARKSFPQRMVDVPPLPDLHPGMSEIPSTASVYPSTTPVHTQDVNTKGPYSSRVSERGTRDLCRQDSTSRRPSLSDHSLSPRRHRKSSINQSFADDVFGLHRPEFLASKIQPQEVSVSPTHNTPNTLADSTSVSLMDDVFGLKFPEQSPQSPGAQMKQRGSPAVRNTTTGDIQSGTRLAASVSENSTPPSSQQVSALQASVLESSTRIQALRKGIAELEALLVEEQIQYAAHGSSFEAALAHPDLQLSRKEWVECDATLAQWKRSRNPEE